MDVVFLVIDVYGVFIFVMLKLNFDYNEMLNINNLEVLKDIIKVGNINVIFENVGVFYIL